MAYNEVARSGKSTMLAGLCEVMSRSRDKARRRPTGHEYKTGLLRGFRTVVSVDFLCCEDVLLVSVVDLVGPLVAKR